MLRFSIHESPMERQKATRECARSLLFLGENRLAMVLAGIACAVVSFVALFLTFGLSTALYAMPFGDSLFVWLAMQVLALALFWLLAMPLWLGMYRMAIRMVDGYSVGTEDFLCYIQNAAQYRRALDVSLRLILRWLPAFVGFLVMRLFFDTDLVGFFLVCFFVVTVVLSLLLVSKISTFTTVALTDDSLSLFRARAVAAEIISGEQMSLFRFHFDMAWRIILSLIPAGVPLMLHTLPMSMLSAVCYARRLVARDDIG